MKKYNFKRYLDTSKTPLFICIGSELSFYDNTSNRIGDKLKRLGFNVVMNISSNNFEEKYKEVKKYSKETYQHIAIDLSYDGKFKEREKQSPYALIKLPINPGSALGKSHKTLGDVSIHITLNYFEEINNGLDVIKCVTLQEGNKEIYEIEREIVEKIKTLYKEK